LNKIAEKNKIQTS